MLPNSFAIVRLSSTASPLSIPYWCIPSLSIITVVTSNIPCAIYRMQQSPSSRSMLQSRTYILQKVHYGFAQKQQTLSSRQYADYCTLSKPACIGYVDQKGDCLLSLWKVYTLRFNELMDKMAKYMKSEFAMISFKNFIH